jgi:hypothetical protein
VDKLTRTVTIMIAIVIAVSAVLLAFFLTRSNEQKAESSSSVDTDEKATLVSPSIEHVQSMTITNQYGTYTIVPFGDMHGDADTYYTIEGMDINQLDVYSIQNIVKYGCNPVSTSILAMLKIFQNMVWISRLQLFPLRMKTAKYMIII